MVLEQIPRLIQTPLQVVEEPPGKNLVPNASFECGTGGWGSIGNISGWGGNLLNLLGTTDGTTAVDGKQSLKVSLGPDNFPLFYFDYFEMLREPTSSVRTVSLGWLKLDEGERYTLSAWMKSATPGVKVTMLIEGGGAQQVELATQWRRYTITRKAPAGVRLRRLRAGSAGTGPPASDDLDRRGATGEIGRGNRLRTLRPGRGCPGHRPTDERLRRR